MKTCRTCGEDKEFSEFYKHKKFKDGHKTECKDCENFKSRERYLKKKSQGETYIKTRKETQKEYHLKRVYGIDLKQYNQLLEKQEHKCAVCKRHRDEFNKDFAVDHAHTGSDYVPEGAVRGLLCWGCNRLVIGRLTDPEIFKNASEYLRQHSGWIVPEEFTKGVKKRRKRKKKKKG